MNDQRFFDLAMKVIARHATDTERAELDSVMANEPKWKREFERLAHETKVAEEVLPLVAATQSSVGQMPDYARERLMTKVRQTLGRPEKTPKKTRWWLFALVPATALLTVLLVPLLRTSPEPLVQLAMLDVAGGTRGSDTNEVAAFEKTWGQTPLQTFDKPADVGEWERNWPPGRRSIIKVVYDRAAAEIRVSGQTRTLTRQTLFQQTFPVETDLPDTLQKVKAFIQEQTGR